MLVGTKNIAVGDTRRVEIDYSTWLLKGDVIANVSASIVNLTPGGTSSLGATSLDAEKHTIHFFVTAGKLNETFTIQVQVTDTVGQVVNDTVDFTVVTP